MVSRKLNNASESRNIVMYESRSTRERNMERISNTRCTHATDAQDARAADKVWQ